MERLIKIAADLLDFCEIQGWRVCVIGGLAVQRWGEPRLTRDVDLSLNSYRAKASEPALRKT